MDHKLILTEAARADLRAIFDYSRTHYPATFRSFRACVDETLAELASYPLRWALWRAPDIRRRIVAPHPYSVYYFVADPHVIVEAVLHQRQDPTRRLPP